MVAEEREEREGKERGGEGMGDAEHPTHTLNWIVKDLYTGENMYAAAPRAAVMAPYYSFG